MSKVVVITIKPIRWLKLLLNDINPDVQIIYSGPVYDLNHQNIRIRRHKDDKLYMYGEPLCTGDTDYIDYHEIAQSIPKQRYIYMHKHPHNNQKIIINESDTIIAMPHYDDFEAYLAINAFMEMNHKHIDLKNIKCVEITPEPISITENKLAEFSTAPSFGERFEEIFAKRMKDKFRSKFPISRDIRYLFLETRLEIPELASRLNIDEKLIHDWRRNPDTVLDYLYDLIEYKLLNEGII